MGVFLIIGLFTPLSTAAALLFVVNLFLASYGTGEWPWTYIMMAVMLAITGITKSGRALGADHYLLKRFGEPRIPFFW
jgi:hypothetical protein